MKNFKLYAVLLGGRVRKNSLMEDHEVVFVVAKEEESARQKAKDKWNALDIHVDGTQVVDVVDGYKINVSKGNIDGDNFILNQNYSK